MEPNYWISDIAVKARFIVHPSQKNQKMSKKIIELIPKYKLIIFTNNGKLW